MANLMGMLALEPPKIVAKTAAYTIKASETGTIFTTVGATAAVVFTLPRIAEGPWHFKFVNCVDLAMTITTPAGTADKDHLIADNAVDNDSIAVDLTGARIGGMIEVYCDGTSLFAHGVSSVALIGTG
jgi:hypothetical protein